MVKSFLPKYYTMMNTYQFPWFYKVLDLPTIPQEIEQLIWQRYQDPQLDDYKYTSDQYLNRRVELESKPGPGDVVGVRNGETFPNGRGARYAVQNQVDEWVRNNITDQYNDTGIYVIFGDKYHTVLPHTDQTRVFSLLYLLEPGGENTHTDFWQQRGHSVHREMKTFGCDYNELDLLASERWPLRTWILLNTNVLHSVEELTSRRVQFQVSLDYEPNIVAKYIKEL